LQEEEFMNFNFSEEQSAFQQKVRDLARDKIAPRAEEWDESEDHSWDLWTVLKEAGLFRVLVPEEYGGEGVSSVKICIAREELARVCVAAEYMVADQGTGSCPIVLAGTEEQKRRHLPGLAAGDTTAALCVTEPGGGSDVGGIQTTAVLDGDHYVLNGTKSFLHKPLDLNLLSVFAKTDPTQRTRGISGFLVNRETPGITAQRYRLMFAIDIGQLSFNDCRVPKDSLLGEVGRGMRVALGALNVMRCTVGASAVGMAQAALDLAVSYGNRRIAFGQPLTAFQWWQFKLAEMATELDAARLLVYRAAQMRDDQPESIVIKEASMAKLFGTEVAGRIIDQTLQIHGGHGLRKGSRIERLYRQTRANRIYEGTNEIQKLTIARSILKG
jgi:alkylation response protein AidB-like acyl-CoA dehydrogenase